MCYDVSKAKCYHISATKIRRNAIGLSLWKFGDDSKHTWKTSIKTTPFLKQTLKPNTFKTLEANANNSFSTANVQKL